MNSFRKCPKFNFYIHNEFEAARAAECTCSPAEGCNYQRPGACRRCGWVNDWTDSGDRGAAQADHDRKCA